MLSMTTTDDWCALQRIRARPLPLTEFDDPDLVELRSWVHGLHVPTRNDAIWDQIVREKMDDNGGESRAILALSAEGDFGKSALIYHWALQRSHIWDGRLPHRDGWAHLPTLYLKADNGGRGPALLRQIASFAGVPVGATRGPNDLALRLADNIRDLGTTVIVIDDCHMIPGGKLTADTWRTAISRLPVTWIFAGVGADTCAIYSIASSAVEETAHFQNKARSTRTLLPPFELPQDKERYLELIKNYARAVHEGIPSMRFSGLLNSTALLKELNDKTAGSWGRILQALKQATVAACRDGSFDVSPELIRAKMPASINGFNERAWE